jgi:hypothetical protein
VFIDYFLCSFLSVESGKIRRFEFYPGKPFDHKGVSKIMNTHTTVGFNSLSYDLLVITCAINGSDNQTIKELSDEIVMSDKPSWQIADENNITISSRWDHIDLMGLCPGRSSLKIYGGRMNVQKMQDLPLDPSASVRAEDRDMVRLYCDNDLYTTKVLFENLLPAVNLRKDLCKLTGLKLMSKSDPQIAEALIRKEHEDISKQKVYPTVLPDSYLFRYKYPKIIKFKSKELNDIYHKIRAEWFTLTEKGSVTLPDWLSALRVTIGKTTYQLGIGGIHSCEKSMCVEAKDDEILLDADVASYYPNLILQQQVYPESFGPGFLTIYQKIVDKRILAKREVYRLDCEIKLLEKEIEDAYAEEALRERSRANATK